MQSWLRERALLELARDISRFTDLEALVSKDYQDIHRAADPSMIGYFEAVLRSWFALAPKNCCEDPWSTWAASYGIDASIMEKQLAPALDIVLETLLRSRDLLDEVA